MLTWKIKAKSLIYCSLTYCNVDSENTLYIWTLELVLCNHKRGDCMLRATFVDTEIASAGQENRKSRRVSNIL